MRRYLLILLLVGGAVAASASNLVDNGDFEQGAKHWGRIGLQDKKYSNIDTTTAHSGKKSYRLGSVPYKKYTAVLQSVKGMNTLDQIKQPLKISVWMKTANINPGPGKGNAVFTFWTYTVGGRNGTIINIASATGTTDWKEYTMIVTPAMIRKIQQGKSGDQRLGRWSLRANLWSQDGSMWIDNVRCEIIKTAPVTCKLDAPEYTTAKKIAKLTVKLADKLKLKAQTVFITIVSDRQPIRDAVKKISGTPADIKVDISGLKPGKYRLKADVSNSHDKLLGKAEVKFNIIEDPFSF